MWDFLDQFWSFYILSISSCAVLALKVSSNKTDAASEKLAEFESSLDIQSPVVGVKGNEKRGEGWNEVKWNGCLVDGMGGLDGMLGCQNKFKVDVSHFRDVFCRMTICFKPCWRTDVRGFRFARISGSPSKEEKEEVHPFKSIQLRVNYLDSSAAKLFTLRWWAKKQEQQKKQGPPVENENENVEHVWAPWP